MRDSRCSRATLRFGSHGPLASCWTLAAWAMRAGAGDAEDHSRPKHAIFWKLTQKLTILQREAPYFNLWKYTKFIEILYQLNQSLNAENNWVYTVNGLQNRVYNILEVWLHLRDMFVSNLEYFLILWKLKAKQNYGVKYVYLFIVISPGKMAVCCGSSPKGIEWRCFMVIEFMALTVCSSRVTQETWHTININSIRWLFVYYLSISILPYPFGKGSPQSGARSVRSGPQGIWPYKVRP